MVKIENEEWEIVEPGDIESNMRCVNCGEDYSYPFCSTKCVQLYMSNITKSAEDYRQMWKDAEADLIFAREEIKRLNNIKKVCDR